MGFDETTLCDAIRTRLAHLRSCGNVQSVTVTSVTDSGAAIVILVPTVGSGTGEGDWGQPSEPFTMLIPNPAH